MFYTALYRCYERMVNITEDGQYYSAFDHQVHQDARPFYVDNWLWDTYRALEPLQTLLNPKMEADKIQSYVRMYQQLGWMPTFAVLWGNHECMTGNPAAPWMADAWAKGITNFDLDDAPTRACAKIPWKAPGCRGAAGRNARWTIFSTSTATCPALQSGRNGNRIRRSPFERRQAVSVTLAQSYDDWCTAQMARTLGKHDGLRTVSEARRRLQECLSRGQGPCLAEGCRWQLD